MKMILFLTILVNIGLTVCGVRNQIATAETDETRNVQISTTESKKNPVLVELFTSEGCSSCPPADKQMAFLGKEQPIGNAEIITLALHVDYWNRLGWKDEFSSPLFSQRQEIYAQKFKQDSVYTPQMVVDGDAQFVGSDGGKATNSIIAAAKNPKAKVELKIADEKLKVKISDVPEHENATVFLAIAEDDLFSNVKRGENSGKNLEHAAVVRELKSIGSLGAQAQSLEIETMLQYQPAWKRDKLKFVVFVQSNETRKIYGAQQILAGRP